MDRLDYLARDSFFTGVAEGVISFDRIIKMLAVHDDTLVVEAKGIYSIEKFLISRRLMYWQVYLHKTVLAAEQMLVNLLRRAYLLQKQGDPVWGTPVFDFFLQNQPGKQDFETEPGWLDRFAQLDDFDMVATIKMGTNHPDPIFAFLCKSLLNRNLFRVELQSEPFDGTYVENIRNSIVKQFQLRPEDAGFFFTHDKVWNKAYNPLHDRIMIKVDNKGLLNISEASEQLNIAVLPTVVSKHLLCYPKSVHG